jgi:cytochrome P450
MSSDLKPASRLDSPGAALSLYHLLDPDVLANPYPLFHRLRREAPVHWDSFLHAWIVTRYADVLEVLQTFSANRTPTPEQLAGMGLSQISPLAELLVKQMLFMDAPAHTRLRSLASKAFTPARIQVLKEHIREIVERLLAEVQQKGSMDVIADLAEPLPAIVTAEMLGVPVEDHRKLKIWSANFAEMLGNFQHNPDHAKVMLQTVEEMTAYFREAVEEQKRHPREGLIHSLLTAEIDGDRLTDDEIVANVIITLVGGLETTTNLIGNGVLTLLRYPEQMQKLRDDLSLIPSAVEEMLRFESPSQHTARLAPEDRELGGKLIRKRQAVIAIMAAANRDPGRFSDPDRFDIARQDNRHLAFGYAAHFCFGAPLARMEGQIVFEGLLRTFSNLQMEPQDLVWRTNLGLRGLRSLKVKFDANKSNEAVPSGVSQTGITELR